MLTFIWAGAAIAFIPVLLLVLLLIKADVGDIVYSMLSGSIVGLIAGVFGLAKGIRTDKTVFLVFAGILGGSAGWLFSWVMVRITQINVYSTTALAFDLMVGLVGAASLCFLFMGRYLSEPGRG